MTGLTLEAKGLKAAADAMNRVAQAVQANIPKVTADTLAEAALETVKRLTPGAGDVRGAWHIVTLGDKKRELRVIANLYAATEEGRMLLNILEGGSRPHVILPIPPHTMLRFVTADGEVVFTRKVRHPGTKPYRMVEGAQQELERILAEVHKSAQEMAVTAWER